MPRNWEVSHAQRKIVLKIACPFITCSRSLSTSLEIPFEERPIACEDTWQNKSVAGRKFYFCGFVDLLRQSPLVYVQWDNFRKIRQSAGAPLERQRCSNAQS